MGIATATLAGVNATDGRITIPAWGALYADVTLDREATLTGAVTLKVADLTIQGTVLSGGPAAGRSFYRIVAGAGGWGKQLLAKSYANDLGVKLSTVLGDAASAVGETLDLTSFDTSTRLGPAFVRPADIAGRLLEQLSPGAWYVGEDGKTRLGARPASTLAATAARVSQLDLARGTLTLASETIAGILPGLVVDGLTVLDVEHTFSAKGGLRSTLWGRIGDAADEVSRRLAAWRKLVNQLDPNRKFRAVYEYRVGAQAGNRLALQPVRVSTGMPYLALVPMWGGSGEKAAVQLGSRVLVGFVDGDALRPVVVAFEDPDGPGWEPGTLTHDATVYHVGPSAAAVHIGVNATGVTVGAVPVPVAKSAGVVTALAAIETWAAALQGALNSQSDVAHVGSALAGATATLITALTTTAPVAIPTTVLEAT